MLYMNGVARSDEPTGNYHPTLQQLQQLVIFTSKYVQIYYTLVPHPQMTYRANHWRT